MALTVRDVMVKPVFVFSAGETARRAASFMSPKEIGCLVVMEDERGVEEIFLTFMDVVGVSGVLAFSSHFFI